METLTFDQLPNAVNQLFNKLENIERLLSEKNQNPEPEKDRWFDLNGLVEYDPEGRSKPTFYGYIHRNSIPFHKNSKKITFLKSEIDNWLKSGRRKTHDESAAEADLYLAKRKGAKA